MRSTEAVIEPTAKSGTTVADWLREELRTASGDCAERSFSKNEYWSGAVRMLAVSERLESGWIKGPNKHDLQSVTP